MAEFPLPKFYFEARWGDKLSGTFAEVSGLDAEPKEIEYQVGTIGEYAKFKMTGLKDFGRITLKNGTFEDYNAYSDWVKTLQLNKLTRETLRISLLDENQEAVFTWEAHNARPIRFVSTEVKDKAGEVAIESIEFAHEGLEIVK